MTTLLAFMGDVPHWLRIEGDAVTARGEGLPVPDPGATLIAVLPGAAVVLHWVDLPDLAPAQAAAAARRLAADVSAAPIETVHVVLGPRDAGGGQPLALVDAGALAGWLGDLAAAGLDPDRVVPAPLLLPMADDELMTILDTGESWLVRGPGVGFAAEPGLASLMIDGAPSRTIDARAFEAGLATRLAEPLLDLREGRFARQRQWHVDGRRARRAGLLALGIAATLLATEITGLLRDGFAADRSEQRLADAARAVLPRGTPVTDPRGQVAARLATLGGTQGGFGALAGPLLDALKDRPAVALDSLVFARGSGLAGGLVAPAASDRSGVLAVLDAAGLDAQLGPPREAGGEVRSELTVGPR